MPPLRRQRPLEVLRRGSPWLPAAKRLAARKGLPYQGLIKMVIHEGLDRLEREAN